MRNYRPESNLTFFRRLLNELPLNGWSSFISLMPQLQSAYQRRHPTETALLRVLFDFCTDADADGQRVTLRGLLALRAAFDCVDHDSLVRRLQSSFGINGSALSWVSSFLEGRTQQVCYTTVVCLPSRVVCSVFCKVQFSGRCFICATRPMCST
jgi:hypothetical protein